MAFCTMSRQKKTPAFLNQINYFWWRFFLKIAQWNLVNNKQDEFFVCLFWGVLFCIFLSCWGAVFDRKTKRAEDKSPAEKGTFPLLSDLDQFRRCADKENIQFMPQVQYRWIKIIIIII